MGRGQGARLDKTQKALCPLDEAHRFLVWQPRATDCYEWSEYLTIRGIEHTIVKNDHGEHTIYKHMAVVDGMGGACCTPRPKSYTQTTGHYVTT